MRFAAVATLLLLLPAAGFADDPVAEVVVSAPPRPDVPLTARATGLVQAGDRMLSDNDFNGAARSYAEAAVAAPRSALPRLLCALSLSAARRTREAVPVLRQAQQLGEDDLVTALFLQGALSEIGDAGESQQIWLECVRRFGRASGGLDASGSIFRLAAAAQQFPRSAGIHLLLADAYQVSQEWPAANREYRLAIAGAPRWAKPRVNLGFALLAQGKPDEAIKALEEGVRQDPGNVRARLAIADAHLKAQRNSEALQTYRTLESSPDVAVAANIGAGQASLNLGQPSAAQGFFDNARRLAPRDPAPAMALGQMQVQQKRFGAAVSSFSTALHLAEEGGLFSARPSLLRAIASAHLEARRPDEALKTLEQALAQEPAEAPRWHRMAADAYTQRGDFVGVEAALRRSLDAETTLYPQATLKAIDDRGLTRKLIAAYQGELQGARTGVAGGRDARAVPVLRSVQPSRDGQVVCLAALGHLFRFVGDDVNEISVRRELGRLRGAGADWFLLAEAFERAGRVADARSAFREAVSRGGLPPAAQAVATRKLRD